MRIARRGVDFVPPPQPNEASPGNVLEVVEVRGEEEEGEYEDEDARTATSVGQWGGLVWLSRGGRTDKLVMNSTPKRYMSKLPVHPFASSAHMSWRVGLRDAMHLS